MKTTLFVITGALVLALLGAGCGHNSNVSTPAAPVPLDVRIGQYNQILATANDGMVTVVTSLKDAGVMNAESARQIAMYQAAVAKATKGIAEILQGPGTLADKAQLAEKLLLVCVPPPGWRAFGLKDEAQYQALITAMDAMQSTIKLIVQMVQDAGAPGAFYSPPRRGVAEFLELWV